MGPCRRVSRPRSAITSMGRQPSNEGRVLPLLEGGLVGGEERVDESLVLGAVHRAVEVGGALGLGLALVVAGLEPGLGEVDGVEVHDRRDGVEEGEGALVGERADRLGERGGGERAGGDDDARPVGGRQAANLAAVDGDEGVGLEPGGDLLGEGHPVDGQRAAGGDGVAVGAGDDEASRPTHLPVQEADGVLLVVVGAEGIGADELGQGRRSGGRVCRPRGASRAGSPARRPRRPARRPRSRRGRRR